MDRRTFLGSLAALGLGGVLTQASAATSFLEAAERKRPKRRFGKFDENHVVIISDLHTNPGGYQADRLRRTIADILKMKPLPLNVIALGDLAYLTGRTSEYTLLKEIIAPLEASGIRFTMAMGNHDRRENFAGVFPSYAAASLLSDRFVYIVQTPSADIIVLDSLQQGEDENTWITPGALDEPQLKWLEKTISLYTKPFFVTAHHPVGETRIQTLLLDNPFCAGYIHGHDHIWRPGWIRKNYSEQTLLRTLCVPSTGHWGDIGYTDLYLDGRDAKACLHEYEFFFPKPVEEGEPRPAQWSLIEEDHKGAVCSFAYRA